VNGCIVPPGADVYLAVQVLHNWSDGDALRILHRIREAMTQERRLLLIEVVVRKEEPNATVLGDALSLVSLGGTERTEAEWRQLLERGGFRVDAITLGEPQGRVSIASLGRGAGHETRAVHRVRLDVGS
jgi:hypothetical protein